MPELKNIIFRAASLLMAAAICLSLSACKQKPESTNSEAPPQQEQPEQKNEGGQGSDGGDTQPPQQEQPPAEDPDAKAPPAGTTAPASQSEEGSIRVAQSAPVSGDYFSDALFIGDSRTEGLMLYTDLQSDAFCDTGLTVSGALTKAIVKQNDGSKITIPQALEKKKYGKVYIMLGINELGWVYPEVYVKKYEELVRTIRESQPQAVIYLQSILPVSAKKSAQGTFRNERIDEYNQMVESIAQRLSVYYLPVREAMTDADGALPADAATDGIHLKKSYCVKWLDYLKTHTVQA